MRSSRYINVCEDLNALVSVCLHQVCLIINGIQSLHLLTNTRTPAKQHSLCFSLSLFVCLFSVRLSLFCSRLINSSPNRFVRNLFFSGFLDFRQNVRYWWAHSEGTGCGVFCISVLVPEKSSWLSLIVQLALVSVSVWSLRKLSRCC